MKRKEILSVLFLLFIASFFLSFATVLNVFVMGLLVLLVLADSSFSSKLALLKKRKHTWFMFAFALLLISSFLFSDNQQAGNRFLQLRIPLLIFPLSIGLMQMTKEQRDKILLGSAIIITVACLVSLLFALTRYLYTNDPAWLYNDYVSWLIGQQSIYTALLVNISIYVFAYFLFYPGLTKRYKVWLGAGIFLLFIINYLLASRNMMLILYISTLSFSFYFFLTNKKYLQGAGLLLGMILAILLVFKFFPKTINRFKELAFTQFNFQSQAKESHYAGELTPDQWNGANFRLAAWQCGWQLFKEHPLTGVGLGDKKDELFKVYQQKQFHFAINTQKNVHNNYLDILISTGITGLLLFLAGWLLLPLIAFARNKDGLALLILLTFALAMLTENYFDRSIGAMLFGFFITFLLTCHYQRTGIGNRH